MPRCSVAEAGHYEQDSLIRFKATFKNLAGAPTDPTVVTLRITKPGVAAVTYTYGTDQELVRDSAGVFHMDFLCDTIGEHKWRWLGTGAVQIAVKGGFFIDPE
jgi:hypothetical protein